jgi:[ribosomal protein S5]-alanine N-acetyltransferase
VRKLIKYPNVPLSTKINTRRLVIRPYVLSDYKNWSQSKGKQQPSLNDFDFGCPEKKQLTKIIYKKSIQEHNANWKADKKYVLGIFLKKNGLNVGTLDLSIFDRTDIQSANFGYYIYNHSWRNGYAYESAKSLIPFAFKILALHRLEAGIKKENKASICLIKKLGFLYESERKNFLYINNSWIDLRYFVLTPEIFNNKYQNPLIRRESV